MPSHVTIIGAGIGGLAAAALLAAGGIRVTVVEKAGHVGGKARRLPVAGQEIDAGPTVFTLREVFDDIFAACGTRLEDHVAIRPAEVLARHAWPDGSRLDLFADAARSEAAIGAFAGARAAAGYRSLRAEAARIHRILDDTMLRQSKVFTPLELMWRIGPWRMGDLAAIRPYETLWSALGDHFDDPRLRQLYARYTTYCGSSPFKAPATMMLIAHVEAMGVWAIEGGISALAEGLGRIATANGAVLRLGETVTGIAVRKGRVVVLSLEGGERIEADAVIANCDPATLAAGHLGPQAARAVGGYAGRNRSLSALVWLAHARTNGFPLDQHNVFFSPDYAREFADIARGRPPADPSVYVCALDRGPFGQGAPEGRERLQIIVNAPANGDSHAHTYEESERCTKAMRHTLARCGLTLEEPLPHALLTPADFESFSPSTGGAIYGRASHGWAASFLRQGARTRIPGLYCAGGSTHPGAGVPMAALSGQLAARAVLQGLASTKRFHRAAMPGGMSTRSATMGGTG